MAETDRFSLLKVCQSECTFAFLQEDVAGRSQVSQSPFQALQAQNGQVTDAPAPGSFPELDADQNHSQVDWAALGKISELQQLQLTDQLRLLEAQVSLSSTSH